MNQGIKKGYQMKEKVQNKEIGMTVNQRITN